MKKFVLLLSAKDRISTIYLQVQLKDEKAETITTVIKKPVLFDRCDSLHYIENNPMKNKK